MAAYGGSLSTFQLQLFSSRITNEFVGKLDAICWASVAFFSVYVFNNPNPNISHSFPGENVKGVCQLLCCKSWDPTECVIQMTEVTTNNSLIKYCWNIYCSNLWLGFIIIIGWFFGLSPTLERTNLSFHLLENLWLVVFCVSLFFMSLNLSVAV